MTKPKTTITRDSLSQILELKRFPQELIGGSKGQQPSQKKVRWNPESELQKLDYLEKLEQRAQGQENKDEKDKKEGENEDENDGEEDIEEEPSDDDYFQVSKNHMLYVLDLYWFVFLVMCDVIIALKTHIGCTHDAMASS
ncbi:DNA-directed RNA polymerase III subunit RPC7-like isoform X3 [Carya illinoinensis]|nr:DNA-directed RNA polymerase III subunit RPC7-like isoform X3 [Carya illinoinensis]